MTGPSFIQVMACGLFGAKSFTEAMQTCWWLDAQENTWNLNQNEMFTQQNAFENTTCKKKSPFYSGINGLTHCGLEMPYEKIDLVNIGSGYGLLPDGIEPLPEPMLTNHQ